MKLKDTTILVTGGAGLIGSSIIDELLEHFQPARILVLDNFVRGTMANLSDALKSGRVEVIRSDIREFNEIRPHFDGVTAVFHQAALRITQCATSPRECLEVLIDGTFNVLEACVQAHVEKVVAASSASVYGMADVFPTPESHAPYNNRTWYGAAKVANEAMLRSFYDMYGLNYVALRYFNVYGPRMDVFGKYTEVLIRWLECIERQEQPKIFGSGKQTMDFIYSQDVARANLAAMVSDVTDDVFNVGSGTETSLRELLERLLRLTDNEHLEPAFCPERNVNPVPRRLADTTKAAQKIGFCTQVSLDEGLKNLIDWRQKVLKSKTCSVACT
jgi:UDP-glucose 4-epimerase